MADQDGVDVSSDASGSGPQWWTPLITDEDVDCAIEGSSKTTERAAVEPPDDSAARER
jgi:hypothetical protein